MSFDLLYHVPNLKMKVLFSLNLLVMQISCQWAWKFRGLHMLDTSLSCASLFWWCLKSGVVFNKNKKKLKRQVLEWYAMSYQSHMSYSMKNLTHMLLDVLLSFVKLCDPSEMLSCFLDHKHWSHPFATFLH